MSVFLIAQIEIHDRTRYAEYECAKAWYFSEEYQHLAKHRFASSDANIVLLNGLELEAAGN